jgi:predicted metal-dependent phosphoesterase TrpH
MAALDARGVARAPGDAMSGWTLVQHAHTRRSIDSLTDPRALVERAEALAVDVLAVTDHDTWQGALDCRDAAERAGLGLRVVLGAEYASDQGDIIGLFLTAEIAERRALALCDAIHAQGGLVLLPHPFRWRRFEEALLGKVDLIEAHNGRTSRADNVRAAELAFERRIPALAGPDAHRASELALARNRFEGSRPADEAALKRALLHDPRRYEIVAGSVWNEWLSQAVRLARRPSVGDAYWLVRSGLRRIVKPGEYVLG